MSERFSVESVRLRPAIPVVPPSGIEQDIYGPCEFGVLTREDKKALEEYSGYKFDFPPKSGQPFPPEMTHIAQARGAEYRDGVGFSPLSALLGQIQNTYRRMTGSEVISRELIAFVSDRSRTGGGSWAGYNS